MIELFDYQQRDVENLRNEYAQGKRAVLYVLPTGGGKCLGRGTPILMYDGTIKAVENVAIGDLLMGPDSKPRKVHSLAMGREALYRVTPAKGDSYVVNESHILSLKRTNISAKRNYPSTKGGQIVNIGVKEYLAKSKTFKHTYKGWRSPVDFQPHIDEPRIEPYFLGLWLGDGSAHKAAVTTMDEEVVSYLYEYASRIGMQSSWEDCSELAITVNINAYSHTGRGGTFIMNALRSYDLIKNKHIPHRFKTGSREERLQLLAGLLDSDGHYTGKGYDVIFINEKLMDDFIFLVRSLGFSAYKKQCRKTCHNNGVTGTYWRCNVSGYIETIPCRVARNKAKPRKQKKSPLVTGIAVEYIGVGEYFGFEIDGDRLFMLGDFTVTHNTYTFCYIAQNAVKQRNHVLILVHRNELLQQASASLSKIGVAHGCIAPGLPFSNKSVQVASVQTLIKRLEFIPWQPDLIIVDESHHLTIESTWGKITRFYANAKILGVTATPRRLDGKGLGIHSGGIFESMVVGPSIAELIERGRLAKPLVYAPPTPIDLFGIKTIAGDYAKNQLADAMNKPTITGCAIEHYRRYCDGQPAIAFCASVKHAEDTSERFRDAGYRAASLDGKMDAQTRKQRIADLGSGRLHVLTSCDIVSEGTDIPVVSAAILLRPTQSESLYLQQVGRALRAYPGKSHAIILDHVGNCHRHGMPDAKRNWSLDGAPVTASSRDPSDLAIRQCEQCYTVHKPAPRCPQCGYLYLSNARSIETVSGSLIAVTEADLPKNKIEPLKPKTYGELVKIAIARGVKNPYAWARHVQKQPESRK